jgi:eukaryotic-like serine/threonine-protein kinase
MEILRMDEASWTALNQLLDAALDQPVAQRAQWINALGSEFDSLKPRLRALLAHAQRVETGEFMNTLPKLEFPDEERGGEAEGAQVGPYRLVRELGSGGMGVVWLAERNDGILNRPVALKLPHGAWRRAGLAERLAREREILASLTHANIARLYDAGVTAAHQPYLAIEFVEGLRIDAYCREHALSVRARLGLFLQVANAVAYAHGKLVVHRDLKPANILVTREGEVRLLDFGIAKLLDEGEARETRFTELSGRALTPDYASPEQIRGEPLGVASDVYSLGVVLYELLSGARPYHLQRDSRGALEEAILQSEPVRPSDAAEPSRRRELRGDLDTVILKTLKKQPAERYATAHALLEDLQRYQQSLPVLARADSRWYRARKFFARNRLAVLAGAAIFVALIVGAGVAAWQARVAIAEKARAEAVQEFIAAVFREANPIQGQGRVLSAAELMRQAERRLHERHNATPELRLALLATIGESLYGLQENKDSARVLEEALRLHESAASQDAALGARLHLGLSQAYETLGRDEDALRQLDLALSTLRESEDTEGLRVRARLHEAALAIASADYPRAESAAHAAIDSATATSGAATPEVATGLQRLSHIYTLTKRRELAVEPARKAHEILMAVHGGDRSHPLVIEAGQYYGQSLNATGRFEEAWGVYRDATERAASVFGERSRMYGEMLSAIVPLEIEIGALAEALVHSRASVEIYLLEGEPGSIVHAGRVRKLGSALLASREAERAATTLEEALRLADGAKSDLEAVHSRGSLGLALAQQGQFERADREILRAIGTPGEIATRGQHLAMRNLGMSLRLQGRDAEAAVWLQKAVKQAALQPSHRGDLAQGFLELGLAEIALGQLDSAGEHLSRAKALYDDVQKDRMTPARADLLMAQGLWHLRRKEFPQALSALERADAFWQQTGSQNRWGGETALWLGQSQAAIGEPQVRATLRRAAALLDASPLPADTRLLAQARVR